MATMLQRSNQMQAHYKNSQEHNQMEMYWLIARIQC